MKTIRLFGFATLVLVTAFSLTYVRRATGQAAAYGSRTVQVSVNVVDTSGGRLRYRWRATDGVIANVNSPTTTWTLPASGPGLHFAYVMVSNGMGGYTQRRIAVDTDNLPPAGAPTRGNATLRPPPGPAQVGDYYRSFVESAFVAENHHAVYAPNVLVHLVDPILNTRYPPVGEIATDYKGQFVIAGVPTQQAGGQPVEYQTHCSAPGLGIPDSFCGDTQMLDSATPNYFPSGISANPGTFTPWVGGSLHLSDGSPCGVQDEFFNLHAFATATLLGPGPTYPVFAGPVQVNEFGDFGLPYVTGAAAVRLRCEGATPLIAAVNPPSPGFSDYAAGLNTLAGIKAPVITGMTATLNGASVGLFLPPPSGFPSDVLTRNDGFLTVKGIDSRRGACRYYKAIGAVRDCDSSGNFEESALTYDAWQRAVHIGPYVLAGATQHRATFINRADLNLTREHLSVSYGPTNTAAVVCNHLGPPAANPNQLLNPTQAEIDTAVLNAVANKNLVACVAMDYIAWPGVNNGQPFVRFMIFGPDGSLLPSVNLDGRAEKFVPGTCVVCHGGSHYQGKFPENGSGFANIGAHFLPYDARNFEFAQSPGLTRANQEEEIYQLNQNVLQTGPTIAETELINGWYQSSHVLNTNYTPPSWLVPSFVPASPVLTDFYHQVLAPSCRGCHVSQIEAYNFDHEYNIDEAADQTTTPPESPLFVDADFEFVRSICGGKLGIERNHMMPNSLVTFNRLWSSAGTANDQVAYLNAYLEYTDTFVGNVPPDLCNSTPFPE
jgi:hypothetical protein